MKKASSTIIIAIVAMALMAVSCSQQAEQKAPLASVRLVTEEKALAASGDYEADSWEFQASPQFALGAGEPLHGQTDGWTAMAVTDGSADLGLYTQGSWKFDVRSLNASGNVIASGSSAAYLRAGGTNSVTVAVDADSSSAETGSVRFGIESSLLDSDASKTSFGVSYVKAGGESVTPEVAWTSQTVHSSWYGDTSAVGTGRVYREAEITGLSPGSYRFKVTLTDGTDIYGGQQLAVRVLGGARTTVKGTLLPGEFVQEGLTIVAPGTITGSIDGGALECQKDSSITLTWTPAAGSADAIACNWYADGIPQASEAVSFSYTPVTYGDHTVSVVALGSDMAEIGSASVIVKVRPDEAKTFDSFSSLASLPGVMSRIPADKVLVGFTDSTVKAAGDRITFPYTAKASDLEPVYENLFPLADYADGMTGAAYVNERIVTSSLDAESGLQTTTETTQSPVVVGYIGAATAIALPESIGGIQGVSPENYQSGFAGLSEIVLPDGLADIGCCAFAQCDSLEKVRIPDTVTGIQDGAFEDCGGLTAVTIPSGVTSIGDCAFCGCAGLTSIAIPDGVTRIGEMTFFDCIGLNTISIPDSVTSIGDSAFEDCGLTSIAIPSGVTSIGDSAFEDCFGLTGITIPSGVTSIGDGAFRGCRLSSVILPASLQTCGPSAFADNLFDSISDFSVEQGGDESILYSGPLSGLRLLSGTVTVPQGITRLGNYAFADCTGITGISIPSGITAIGDCAFENCTGLTGITIPSSVTSMGKGAFQNCDNLQTAVLDCRIPSIPDDAFRSCDSLQSIRIPSTVTSIGSKAFRFCSSLSTMTLPAGLKTIGVEAFAYCEGLTGPLELPDGLESIGAQAFYKAKMHGSMDIPSTVTFFGEGWLQDGLYSGNNFGYVNIHIKGSDLDGKKLEETTLVSSAMNSLEKSRIKAVIIEGTMQHLAAEALKTLGRTVTSVSLPDGLLTIGDNAFSSLTAITEISIPSTVQSIGTYSFFSCTGLTSLSLPESLTTIGDSAFCNCSGLASIEIKAGVTSIGDFVFSGCTGLTSIAFGGTVAQWNAITKGSNWKDSSALASVVCTDGTVTL